MEHVRSRESLEHVGSRESLYNDDSADEDEDGTVFEWSGRNMLSFRKELWQAGGNLDIGKLQSMWGHKVELAVRTGFAALLTGIYAVIPQVEKAPWQAATVFAPVTAICAVTGPSLGETFHHGIEFVRGSVLGAFSSMIINEIFRPIVNEGVRETITWGAFIALTLFLTSRPGQPLAQKRFAVGVMLCGTVNMSVKAHRLPWFHPYKVAVPCIVGPIAALIAVLLPWPRTAVAQFRQRAKLQALLQRALLADVFEGFFSNEVASIVSADQFVETIRDNCAKMKELTHGVHYELLPWPSASQRLCSLVKFFEEQLAIFRAIALTLRKTQNDVGGVHEKFLGITESAWRESIKAIAAATDDIVLAEQEGRPVADELIAAVRERGAELDGACEKARKEVLYQGGSLYEPPSSREERHLHHARRIARHFFFNRLSECTGAFAEHGSIASFIPNQSKPSHGPSMGDKLIQFWSWPSSKLWKDAMKKTICMAILSLLAWIPWIRERSPQFIWAFIAASFVMSDFEGSSISTGLGRVFGTLLGGMFGLVCMTYVESSGLQHTVELVIYALIIAAWTTLCCLFKASPRHGYLATVSAFSVSIMIVGALELGDDEALHQKQGIVLHRTEMQFLGAAAYVLVEVLVWPKSARAVIGNQQSKILKAIQRSFAEAMEPYVTLDSNKSESSTEDLSSEDPEAEAAEPKKPAFYEGTAAVAEASASVKAAGLEPSMWQKPFPLAMHERLLRSESRALRITSALHASARGAPLDEVDPDVPPLIATYGRAAIAALDAALADLDTLERQQAGVKMFYNKSARKMLACSGDTIRRPTAATAAAHLLKLHDADKQLRMGMEKHLRRFNVPTPLANSTAYSVNTAFFCCLRFTATMLELADRLRAIEAAEIATIDV